MRVMVRILNLTEWPRQRGVDPELPFRRFESDPLPVPAGRVRTCPILVEIGAATTAPLGPQARVFSQAGSAAWTVRWQGPPSWLLGPASRSSRAPAQLRGDRASASPISSTLAQNLGASKPLCDCSRHPLTGFPFDAAMRSPEGEHNHGLLSRPLLGPAKDQVVRPAPKQPRHRPPAGARQQCSVAGRTECRSRCDRFRPADRSGGLSADEANCRVLSAGVTGARSQGQSECRRREVGHQGGPRPETARATSSSGQVGRDHPGQPGLAHRHSAAMVKHAP